MEIPLQWAIGQKRVCASCKIVMNENCIGQSLQQYLELSVNSPAGNFSTQIKSIISLDSGLVLIGK
jgi:hypothetical protein